MTNQNLISRLAQESDSRIVMIVLDGAGDIRTARQPRTPLDSAILPNLHALAAKSALGRLVPVATGVTPGSGPAHLALFGYDPTTPEADIGRGVLEVLGLGLEIGNRDVAARGNFSTVDTQGNLTDRRAGRIPTVECERLCEILQVALADYEGADVRIVPGEEHRFVMILSGTDLSPLIADTDPQKTGVPPLAPQPLAEEAKTTAQILTDIVGIAGAALATEQRGNSVLLRGLSQTPDLPDFTELYKIRAGAFAGYPLYRGVAAACGMDVVPCGIGIEETITTLSAAWDQYEFFFVHIKQTDKAGEDGDFGRKTAVLEEFDRVLPRILALEPSVVAITADHSTPVPMAAHSWHPVPLLVHSEVCFVDDCDRFTEESAISGHLGTLPSSDLISLLLANGGRLAKFGA